MQYSWRRRNQERSLRPPFRKWPRRMVSMVLIWPGNSQWSLRKKKNTRGVSYMVNSYNISLCFGVAYRIVNTHIIFYWSLYQLLRNATNSTYYCLLYLI